jgi:membrane protein YqaA with SNARE-associated domain
MMERARLAVQRYGVLSVIIPSLLPPPAPFKIFVLLAGVAGISPMRFAVAIAVGRGTRYFIEGLLAVWYGDRAIEYIHAHGRTVALVVLGLVAGGLAAWLLWRHRTAEAAR